MSPMNRGRASPAAATPVVTRMMESSVVAATSSPSAIYPVTTLPLVNWELAMHSTHPRPLILSRSTERGSGAHAKLERNYLLFLYRETFDC